jgi:hypothetical protein
MSLTVIQQQRLLGFLIAAALLISSSRELLASSCRTAPTADNPSPRPDHCRPHLQQQDISYTHMPQYGIAITSLHSNTLLTEIMCNFAHQVMPTYSMLQHASQQAAFACHSAAAD